MNFEDAGSGCGGARPTGDETEGTVLEAYLEQDSYPVGERIPLYVHTTADATARLYRMGRTLAA